MRRSLGRRQRSDGSLPSATEGQRVAPSPPTTTTTKSATPLSSSEHSKRSFGDKTKGLTCAFNALKCSSRASEEDNSPGFFPTRKTESQTKTQTTANDPAEDLDVSSRLLRVSSHESTELAPFEDLEDEEHPHPSAASMMLPPSRTPSDDTHDTAHASNRDPTWSRASSSSSSPLKIRTLSDAGFDEYCQTHFNTPRMLHTNGSLGDSITPLVSPENESGDDSSSSSSSSSSSNSQNHDAQNTWTFPKRSSLDAEAKKELQLPNIHSTGRLLSERESMPSYASSTSFLHGESISGEKKPSSDEFRRLSSSRPAIPEPRGLSTNESYPTWAAPSSGMGTSPERYQSLQSEDSSHSSVSSFLETSKQKVKEDPSPKKRPRPPFFWRSHPAVTVYSYNVQPQQRLPRRILPRSNSDGDLISIAMDESPRGYKMVKPTGRRESRNMACLNPALVRDMWMTSKPFALQVNTNWNVKRANSNRHPQGPPSTRSGAMFQSFTTFASNNFQAVFTRSDSTRLNT